jgi:Mrp family chromosome partitioning ATPase/capsular polysaccharide biosynthesis protein
MGIGMDASTTIKRQGKSATPGIPPSSPDVVRTLSQRGVPEFSDLLLACRHHLVLTIFLGTFAAIGFATIAWFLINPRYETKGLVRVRERQSVIFSAQTTRAEDSAFFSAQTKIVQSSQVLATALNDPTLQPFAGDIPAENQLEWLAGLLQVKAERGSEVLSISIHHESAKLAHALSTAITQAYLAEITHRISFERQQREEEVRRAAFAADQQLDTLWSALNEIAQSIGPANSKSVSLRDELKFQAYRGHARQLESAQMRSSLLQSQLVELQLQADEQTDGTETVPDALLQQHPDVVLGRKLLSSLDYRIEQMQAIVASTNSPRLKSLTDERNLTASELASLEDRIRSEILQKSRAQSLNEQQQSIAKLMQQIESIRNEKEYLRSRLTEIDSSASGTQNNSKTPLDRSLMPLEMARHAVDRQSGLADRLWRLVQELKIEQQSQPRIALLKLPGLPKHADHSRQLKAACGAGLTGWMIVMFVVGYFEWRACRVRLPNDVASRSRYPVFGEVSYLASQDKTILASERTCLTGGVREAGARILLCEQEDDVTASVMVTSCAAHEPRHLIAQELALLLGSFQRRVLLLDCDTEKSQLSHALGAARLSGMRQLSAQANDDITRDAISSLLVPAEQNNVDFIPVGHDEDQQSWVDSRTLRSVIDAMQPIYDAIIVSGPSMIGSAESLLLAAEVETSVFAVFVDGSRWNQLVLCEDAAAQSGLSISGSILHHGKGHPDLHVQTDRQGEGVNPSSRNDETLHKVCEQIDELQQELRRAQSDEQHRESAAAPEAIGDPTRI